jgi:hypothetical protein
MRLGKLIDKLALAALTVVVLWSHARARRVEFPRSVRGASVYLRRE